MSQLKQDLIAVRELLSDPNRWCQRSMECNRKGVIAYCLTGAMSQIGIDDIFGYERRRAMNVAFKKHNGLDYTIPFWNDAPERTHAEVIAALDVTIQAES